MEAIIEAIDNRKLLRVDYDEGERIIEPYALGTNNNSGKTLLRAYQVQGASLSGEGEGWKLMNLKKLNVIEVLHETFSPRPEFKSGDKAMTGGIIAEI